MEFLTRVYTFAFDIMHFARDVADDCWDWMRNR